MGAGIAVLFKKKFGGVQELLSQREFLKTSLISLPWLQYLLTFYYILLKYMCKEECS